MNFSLAIDNDLASELCKFRENSSYDFKVIEKTLHYYKDYPLFTREFLQRYYKDAALLGQILSAKCTLDFNSLENISKATIYKVILTGDKSKSFPYICIKGDIIENNFTASFFKNQSRQKAKLHIKNLLENAQSVFIYDAYLFEKNVWEAFVSLARECFPRTALNVFYARTSKGQGLQAKLSQIKQINREWKISEDKKHKEFTNLHDRYLIIDDKIELIFTSGIEYLMDESKDFTYVVRVHKTR